MKITHYDILTDRTYLALIAEVRAHIKYGWQPLGGIAMSEKGYAQAVVKYKEEGDHRGVVRLSYE